LACGTPLRMGRATTSSSVHVAGSGGPERPGSPRSTFVGQHGHVDYIGRAPAPPLDWYIDDVYCLTGVPRHRRLNVPPMPSAHLFINLGEPVCVYDSDAAVPPTVFTDGWFMGMRTRRVIVEYPSQVRLVGVHFKPWGLSPFVDLPSSELRGRWVPVESGLGPGLGSPTGPGRWCHVKR
jgi:Domain of unknown function (DUF6597)